MPLPSDETYQFDEAGAPVPAPKKPYAAYTVEIDTQPSPLHDLDKICRIKFRERYGQRPDRFVSVGQVQRRGAVRHRGDGPGTLRSVGIRFGRKQFTVYRGDLIRELAHFSQREGPNIRSVVIGSVSDMIITGDFDRVIGLFECDAAGSGIRQGQKEGVATGFGEFIFIMRMCQ